MAQENLKAMVNLFDNQLIFDLAICCLCSQQLIYSERLFDLKQLQMQHDLTQMKMHQCQLTYMMSHSPLAYLD